jgi:hypothetical protein
VIRPALLDISVDRPVALVCVRLSDVAPDGQVTKVTYGLLNLTHRDGPSNPAKLEPGRRYKVKVRLNEIAHVFAPGHRLRVAVSTSCFPLTWPSPEPVTLTLHTGESRIELPFMKEGALRVVDPFAPAECARPRPTTEIRAGSDERQIIHDLISGRTTMHVWRDDGCARIDDIGTEVAYSKLKDISIAGDDPLSMRVTVATSHTFHARRLGRQARHADRHDLRQDALPPALRRRRLRRTAPASSAAASSTRLRGTICERRPAHRRAAAGGGRDRRSPVDHDGRRLPPRGPTLAADERTRDAGAGDPRIHPLSPARRHHHRRHAPPRLFRRPRLCLPARGHAGLRRFPTACCSTSICSRSRTTPSR